MHESPKNSQPVQRQSTTSNPSITTILTSHSNLAASFLTRYVISGETEKQENLILFDKIQSTLD